MHEQGFLRVVTSGEGMETSKFRAGYPNNIHGQRQGTPGQYYYSILIIRCNNKIGVKTPSLRISEGPTSLISFDNAVQPSLSLIPICWAKASVASVLARRVRNLHRKHQSTFLNIVSVCLCLMLNLKERRTLYLIFSAPFPGITGHITITRRASGPIPRRIRYSVSKFVLIRWH